MANVHPTTAAIISGLRGEAYDGLPFHRALADQVRHLVFETKLHDAEEIAQAGLAGWDLGFRQDGHRYEISARYHDERQCEIVVTALLDKNSGKGWSFHWFVQAEDPAKAFPNDLYPNGAASSFSEAASIARRRI